MHRRDLWLAFAWMLCMPLVMYAIAAFDPMSWHAHDAGYPSVALLVLFAAGVAVVGAAALWVARVVRYPKLFAAGVAGVAGGILGNVSGILTIHGLGGGNSAADIWSYPVIWYVGNPADASIALGAVLLLVWVARLVLRRLERRGMTGVMVGVAVLPLLVAGTYTVARSAEIVGWQPSPNAQLTRVVAHRAGLSESTGSRACAAQFSFVYHRPTSVELTAADCPAILDYASKRPSRWATLIGSAPPGTLGAPARTTRSTASHQLSRRAAGHAPATHASGATSRSAVAHASQVATTAPPVTHTSGSSGSDHQVAGSDHQTTGSVHQVAGSVHQVVSTSRSPTAAQSTAPARSSAPSVAVTIGPDGTVVARLSVPPPAQRSTAPHELTLTPAQRRQLPCVRKALVTLARTEPRFAVLAIDALCPVRPATR